MMRFLRTCIAAAVALGVLAAPALAQDTYPSRQIKIIVPYAPGGQGDITARIIADRLGPRLGQSVIVENRAGANGTIGTDAVAKARPDGYTLGLVVASHVLLRALMPQLTFDPIEDFIPITITARTEMVMVTTTKLPLNSVKELVDYARAHPEEVSYKSAGSGSNSHLFGAWFADAAGVRMTHVPYKGSGSSIADLISGVVQMGIDTLPAVQGYIDNGQLKLVAVGGPNRSPHYPNVPTIAEAGVPGFAANSWGMVIAPKGTPAPIIARLNAEITAILKSEDVKARFDQMGAVVVANSPAEALALEKREEALYTDLIGKLKIELK